MHIGEVWRQQFYQLWWQKKLRLILVLLTLLLAGLCWRQTQRAATGSQLQGLIFERFNLLIIYFPISLFLTLHNFQHRLTDYGATRTNDVWVKQDIANIILAQLTLTGCFVLGTFIGLNCSGKIMLVSWPVWFGFIYLLLGQLFLSFMLVMICRLTHSKPVSFMLVFGFIGLDFWLLISKRISLLLIMTAPRTWRQWGLLTGLLLLLIDFCVCLNFALAERTVGQ
ncbi:hypothetical protein [Lapidilactobacillus wuchangensis]|uniref:hypothetical protein n=1 Tax=Lapidilactobacillus wuchangensis TaxID=2486001 RepID=UPI000F794E99|nr:hypothetical protein [Lapidilactobacillus wuchangensis]